MPGKPSTDPQMVPSAGLEPAWSFLRGIFVPATAFAADPRFWQLIWSLDFLFAVRSVRCATGERLGRGRQVSTLSARG